MFLKKFIIVVTGLCGLSRTIYQSYHITIYACSITHLKNLSEENLAKIADLLEVVSHIELE